ncbi:MAG TPA: prepilin peptidase [Nitrosospira sp.]|nr:prepilin peptidase [Nitrosospira sp.]
MYPLTIGILLLLLLVAALHDVRTRRIPNVLVLTGVIAGLSFNSLLPKGMGGLGAFASLAGVAAGLLLLLPLYLFRAMGAGDVKLMSMIGAFLGVAEVMHVFIYVLLAGGLLAMGTIWARRKPQAIPVKLRKMRVAGTLPIGPVSRPEGLEDSASAPAKTVTLPYGVAIALGTAWYLVAVPLL